MVCARAESVTSQDDVLPFREKKEEERITLPVNVDKAITRIQTGDIFTGRKAVSRITAFRARTMSAVM